jgi:hypothetical protein
VCSGLLNLLAIILREITLRVSIGLLAENMCYVIHHILAPLVFVIGGPDYPLLWKKIVAEISIVMKQLSILSLVLLALLGKSTAVPSGRQTQPLLNKRNEQIDHSQHNHGSNEQNKPAASQQSTLGENKLSSKSTMQGIYHILSFSSETDCS